MRVFNSAFSILFITVALIAMLSSLIMFIAFHWTWTKSFEVYQAELLQVDAYKFVEDMRERGIKAGPFDQDEEAWLNRKAELYGLNVVYRNPNENIVWFESETAAEILPEKSTRAPLIDRGNTHGYLVVAYKQSDNMIIPLNSRFERLMSNNALVTLYSVLAGIVLVSIIAAYKLSHNWRKMRDSFLEIQTGKRAVQVPIAGPEELQEMAQTVNLLLDELKTQGVWMQQMMEDLAHEVRTPLTSIISEIEAMIDGVYEMNTERLNGIYQELERLTRLIRDVEKLSEAEGARFDLNINKEDIVELVKSIYRNFQIVAKEKGIRFELDPPYVPCYAEVDRDRIVQVISNLVSNAMKYTPNGGKVTLGLHYRGNYVFIYCQDDGVGINQEDLSYIFSRFYRADKSRSRESGGLGLGLSIAKVLVEAHNGHIEVQSKLGEGSTFMIYIPLHYQKNKSSSS